MMTLATGMQGSGEDVGRESRRRAAVERRGSVA